MAAKRAGGAAPATSESISIALSSSARTVTQGSTTTLTVTLTRNGGYTGTVTPSVSGLPTGVTGSWSDSSLTGADATTVLTLTAAADAPTVTTDAFTITCSGSGVSDATAAATVTVQVSAGFHFQYTPDSLTPSPSLNLYSGNVLKPVEVVADATALDGFSIRTLFGSGGENQRDIEYTGVPVGWKKIHVRTRWKIDSPAVLSGTKKHIRTRGINTGTAAGVGTLDIVGCSTGGSWVAVGDNIGNGENIPCKGHPDYGSTSGDGFGALFTATRPETFVSTWRYVEFMVDYSTSALQVIKAWVDGTLIMERSLAITALPSDFSFSSALAWTVFNSPGDDRYEWIDDFVVHNDFIGVP